MGIETVKEAFELAGLVLSGIIAIGVWWWKAAQNVHKITHAQAHTQEQLLKMADTNLKLTEAVTVFGVKIDGLEKDISKLEGGLEVQRRDTMNLISTLQQTTSSLDALWRTLQNMYPDKVPRRASDK